METQKTAVEVCPDPCVPDTGSVADHEPCRVLGKINMSLNYIHHEEQVKEASLRETWLEKLKGFRLEMNPEQDKAKIPLEFLQ